MTLLWSGLAFSAVGDQAYLLALSWISTEAFGSWAGWLVALGPASVLLTVLFGGTLADRHPPLVAMIAADAARAAALIGVVAAWSMVGSAPAVALALAIVVLGVGQAVFRPALQVVVPAIVADRTRLPAANALLDATERLARLAGPGLAGPLSGVMPLRHVLTLNALTYAISAAALWTIGRHRPIARPETGSNTGPARRVIDAMVRGFAVTGGHRLMGWVLMTSGPLNGMWFVSLFIALPLSLAENGTGLAGFGLVISAYGCTNLAANLFLGSREMTGRPARQICAGNVVLGSGMLLIAAAQLLPPDWRLLGAMAGAAAGAAGGPMQDIPVAVLRQTAFPAADVPAVMRAALAASQLGLLLGLLVAPAMLRLFGPTWLIAVCAAAILGLGVQGLWRFSGAPSEHRLDR